MANPLDPYNQYHIGLGLDNAASLSAREWEMQRMMKQQYAVCVNSNPLVAQAAVQPPSPNPVLLLLGDDE